MPDLLSSTSGRALRGDHPVSNRPALISIPDSCRYMGGISRAKFYTDVLPKLDTVHIGKRHLIVVASLDQYIAKLTVKAQRAAR